MKINEKKEQKNCGSCQYHDWDEAGDKTDFCILNGMSLTGREDEVDGRCPLKAPK